jgi:hypothetical protein
MDLHVAKVDDLISVLDRILDKGIIVEAGARLTLQGCDLVTADSRIAITSTAVYVGYGKQGTWQEGLDVEELFPFWRRDLWSK